MLLNNQVKQSPIIGLAGMGGGISSYVFLSADGGYEISRSLRFNSADSDYLTKTYASDGNRKTWTLSLWFKRSSFGTSQSLLSSDHDSGVYLDFNETDNLRVLDGGMNVGLDIYYVTSAVYRDPSAWYHVVVSIDTTQATPSNRVKIYINGSQVTAFSTSNAPPLNFDTTFNSTRVSSFGRNAAGSGGWYFNGYMADVWFVDGQALEPTAFGEFDATTGVWNPKSYTGAKSGNSFHLDFADNSSAAALGYDAAGSNDWAVNNISLGGTLIYSSYLTSSTGSFYANRGPEKGFDGLAGTPTGCSALGSSPIGTNYLQYTPPSPVSVASSINFLMWDSDHQQQISINGGAYQVIPASTSPSISFTGTVTSIRISSIDGGRSAGAFSGLGFDGIILIDAPRNDSLLDSPSNDTDTGTGIGGEITGNYATLNPIAAGFGSNNQAATFSNGNLDWTTASTFYYASAVSTIAPKTGKYYVEAVCQNASNSGIGFVNAASISSITGSYGLGAASDGWHREATVVTNNNSNAVTGMSALSVGDIIGLALDLDNGKAWWSKNGTWHNSGNPANGTNATVTFTPGNKDWLIGCSIVSPVSAQSVNFGQRVFAHSAPTGFKALNTAALPTPAIEKGSNYVGVTTYTGNGGTQSINVGFAPDFVWYKYRSGAAGGSNLLFDTVRGATNALVSNSTGVEVSISNALTSFNSTGFSVGDHSSSNYLDDTYVAWAWKAGGNSNTFNVDGTGYSTASAAGLTAGDLTITGASINTTSGFSIIKYTGGAANSRVAHGLNSAPSFIICKSTTAGQGWPTYHYTQGKDKVSSLNTVDGYNTNSNYWGTSEPDGNTFGVADVNYANNYGTMIAYCWHDVPGLQKFGSYTSNGNANGPFVELGFRPALVIIKSTTNPGSDVNWTIQDSERSPYNYSYLNLSANSSGGDNGSLAYPLLDFLSNGFKIRNTFQDYNYTGATYTYVYAAWAETPFSTQARAR